MVLTPIISNCAISLKTSVRKIGLHIIRFAVTAGLNLFVHKALQVTRIELAYSVTKNRNTMFAFERYVIASFNQESFLICCCVKPLGTDTDTYSIWNKIKWHKRGNATRPLLYVSWS